MIYLKSPTGQNAYILSESKTGLPMPITNTGAALDRLTIATLLPVPCANMRAKRMLDLTLGIPIALLASPLLLMIWVTYKLLGIVFRDDRGPVFRQVYRHAYGGVIPVIKIRISKMEALAAKSAAMREEEVAELSRQLGEDGPRLGNRAQLRFVEDAGPDRTRLGKLIKKMYLDELPQIFNVLKGEMSFVGPRPVPLRDWRCSPDHDGWVTLEGERFDYRHRDKLPGGLTGLYQANKSTAVKVNYGTFLKEGVALDRQYYELLLQATPWKIFKTDLTIICRTIPVLLRHEGI